jgi:nucleotide-binding universal stress UspA family protein
MVDITQASDTEIAANVDAFAAALRSRTVTLPDVRLERILLAVDESNQGQTAENFAAELATRHAARVSLLYAYEGTRDNARERYLTDRAHALTRAGVTLQPLDAPVRTEHGKRSFEQLLETSRDARCDLVVLPAPYLDDYRRLGEESVGPTADVLISRSSIPLLIVRAPEAQPEACLSNALLPITPCHAATIAAGGWALKLLRGTAVLQLLAVAGHDEVLHAASEQGTIDVVELDAEKLAGLRNADVAGLVAELQRRTAELGIRCQVLVRAGDLLDTTIAVANDTERTLVLPRSGQRQSQVFTSGVLRCSRNPVLVVKE